MSLAGRVGTELNTKTLIMSTLTLEELLQALQAHDISGECEYVVQLKRPRS